jgi:glycerol kinase
MVFDAAGAEVARRQIEHTQILPKPGWVEHDPIEIAARTNEVITGALRAADLDGKDLAAIGVTNQRETTVVWNPKTGRPWHNAIVHIGRIGSSALRAETQTAMNARDRRPPPTFRHEAARSPRTSRRQGRRRKRRGGLRQCDTWVIWNLTGGADGGVYVTDVTNASRNAP